MNAAGARIVEPSWTFVKGDALERPDARFSSLHDQDRMAIVSATSS